MTDYVEESNSYKRQLCAERSELLTARAEINRKLDANMSQ